MRTYENFLHGVVAQSDTLHQSVHSSADTLFGPCEMFNQNGKRILPVAEVIPNKTSERQRIAQSTRFSLHRTRRQSAQTMPERSILGADRQRIAPGGPPQGS